MWKTEGRLRVATELIQLVNQIISCSHRYHSLSSLFSLTLFDCLDEHKQEQTKPLFFLPPNAQAYLNTCFPKSTPHSKGNIGSAEQCVSLCQKDLAWSSNLTLIATEDLVAWLTFGIGSLTIVPWRKTHFLLWDPEHCPQKWRKTAHSGAGSQCLMCTSGSGSVSGPVCGWPCEWGRQAEQGERNMKEKVTQAKTGKHLMISLSFICSGNSLLLDVLIQVWQLVGCYRHGL